MKRYMAAGAALFLCASLVVTSTACTNMNRTQQGALSGAGVGALAGAGISAIAGGSGTWRAASTGLNGAACVCPLWR
mgnify:CR=1 FL=1